MEEKNIINLEISGEFFKIGKIKKNFLKTLIGIFIISLNSNVKCIKIEKGSYFDIFLLLNKLGKKFFSYDFSKKKRFPLNFHIISGFFIFLNELFIQKIQKSENLAKKLWFPHHEYESNCVNERNSQHSLKFAISSSINMLKQEIIKLKEMNSQLEYFITSINSINSIQNGLRKKFIDLKKKKKIFKVRTSGLSVICYNLILLGFLFYCTFLFIYWL
jgi:hypothetical protein